MNNYFKIGLGVLFSFIFLIILSAQKSIIGSFKTGSYLQIDSTILGENNLYIIDTMNHKEFIGSIKIRPAKWNIFYYTNFERFDQKNISIIFTTKIGIPIYFHAIRMFDRPNYFDNTIYDSNRWIVISEMHIYDALPMEDRKIIESVIWHTPTLFTLNYKEYLSNGKAKRTPSQTLLFSYSQFIDLPKSASKELTNIKYRNDI